MRSFLILFLGVMVFWGCSDRERLNPLDPENPFTFGAPTGLRARVNRDTVQLSWNSMQVDDLELYRLNWGELGHDLDNHVDIPWETTRFQHTGRGYDVSYRYSITAVTSSSRSRPSDTLSVVPGPWNIWVADRYDYRLKRVSYDGTHILDWKDFSAPVSIVYDSSRGSLWLADYYQQRIVELDRDFEEKTSIPVTGYPVFLAADPENQRLFSVQTDGSVQGYGYGGESLLTLNLEQTISVSTEMLYDARTRTLWITSFWDNAVIQVQVEDSSGASLLIVDLSRPGPIEVDPLQEGIWVATDSGIVRISYMGETQAFHTNISVKDISIDPVTGDCYYVGEDPVTGTWETGHLAAGDPVQKEILLGNEYPHLYNIQVIPGTGESGFLVQQAYTWRLMRFTATGSKIGELNGFNSRLNFALD